MKTVLITGGSRGIGGATALHCARRGMGVVLTYKDNRRSADTVVTHIEADGGYMI